MQRGGNRSAAARSRAAWSRQRSAGDKGERVVGGDSVVAQEDSVEWYVCATASQGGHYPQLTSSAWDCRCHWRWLFLLNGWPVLGSLVLILLGCIIYHCRVLHLGSPIGQSFSSWRLHPFWWCYFCLSSRKQDSALSGLLWRSIDTSKMYL